MAENSKLITKPVNNTKYAKHIRKHAKLSMSGGPWVAGGSVRKVWFNESWEHQDVDFFFSNAIQLNRFVDNIKKLYSSKKEKLFHDLLAITLDFNQHVTLLVHETDNAISWTIEHQAKNKFYKVQAIKKFFPQTVEDLFATFDLTVAQFATDGYQMIASPSAIEDCNSKIIRATSSDHQPSISRILKYTAYGFTPPDDMMQNVLQRLVKGETVGINDDY